MIAEDMPEPPVDIYNRSDIWEQHDGKDQDFRRARWVAILAAWALGGGDEMVRKLIGRLDLPELIDLDATLTSLRYEIRRAIVNTEAPWIKRPLGTDEGDGASFSRQMPLGCRAGGG